MSSDPFGAIGSMFNSVVQGVEQNVENTLGTVMNEFGGAQSGKGISGGGFINDTMDNFSLGGMFGANGEGFAGELFGSFMGSEFGILGGIFAGNSDPSSVGNGYAPPPPPPCGNTGSTGSTHTATPGGQQLDPRIDQEIAALETLMANFDKVSNNGTMTKADLQKASLDSSNPELQKAAKFFLANQDCLNQLMAGNNGNGATWDRMYALDQGLSQLKAAAGDTQTVNAPPPGPSGTTPTSTASTSTGGSGSTSDVNGQFPDIGDLTGDAKKTPKTPKTPKHDTTGNTGEFGKAMDTVDSQIADLENQINNSSDSNLVQKLQSKLKDLYLDKQMLVELEQQMFQLKSEMAKAYHDMSMTAIRNING